MFACYAYVLQVDFLVIGNRPQIGSKTEGGSLRRKGRDPEAEYDQAFVLCRATSNLKTLTETALSLKQVDQPQRAAAHVNRTMRLPPVLLRCHPWSRTVPCQSCYVTPGLQAVTVVKEAQRAHNKPLAVVLALPGHYESVGLFGASEEEEFNLRCAWGNNAWPHLLTNKEKGWLERDREIFEGNDRHQVSPIYPSRS